VQSPAVLFPDSLRDDLGILPARPICAGRIPGATAASGDPYGTLWTLFSSNNRVFGAVIQKKYDF
jgi:hypothetical protein